MLTFKELESDFATRVKGIDATAFKQGSVTADFTESSVPLSAIQDAYSLGHLNFSVHVEDAPNSNRMSDHYGGSIELSSTVVVSFAYHVRPSLQITDARLSGTAALDIVKAVMAPYDKANINLVNAYRPLLSPDGEWIMATVTFQVLHEVGI